MMLPIYDLGKLQSLQLKKPGNFTGQEFFQQCTGDGYNLFPHVEGPFLTDIVKNYAQILLWWQRYSQVEVLEPGFSVYFC